MAKRVFLSHCSSDKARFVDGFVCNLRTRHGISVWYDTQALEFGELLAKQIEDGLDSADVFVVVLSRISIKRKWVLLEIATAISLYHKGKCRILPVALEDVEVPSLLSAFPYIRIRDVTAYDNELGRIVDGVRSLMSAPDVSPATGLDAGPVTAPAVSHRLPMPPQRFVNRRQEIDELETILEEAIVTPGSSVAVVHGMPGVGKSSLASLWANSIRHRFPDGSLYVDFGSRGPDKPIDVDDVMAQLLAELGADTSAIAPDRTARQQTYDRLTDSKQMLVFADNVTDYAQIRQIRPRGDGSLVIAAASLYSKEFDLEDAESVKLSPLRRPASVAMIRRLSGSRRRDDSDSTLEDLAEHCGDLPVALAVAASHLRRHRSWTVSDFLERIAAADNRLEAVADGNDRVAGVFDEVYKGLSGRLQRFYRRLGLFPGMLFTADTAAATTGVPAAEARALLEELHDTHLVDEIRPGRYQRHALIGEHMRHVFAVHENPETAGQLALSLVDWYRRAVMDADVAVSRERLRLAPRTAAVAGQVDVPVFASSAEAQRWYETERHNLVAVMEFALSHRIHEPAWHIAEALWLLYTLSSYFSDWEQSARLGIDAAVECGDQQAEARLRPLLAKVLAQTGRYSESVDELDLARRLVDGTGNAALQAMVTGVEGTCALAAGDKVRAAEALLSARSQHQQLGSARGVAVQDLQLSRCFLESGDFGGALEASRRARPVFEAVPDPMNVAKVVLMSSKALSGLGRPDEAYDAAAEAAALCQSQGMRFHTAESHEAEATALTARGRHAEARTRKQAAYRLYSEIGHESAERLEEQLVGDGNGEGYGSGTAAQCPVRCPRVTLISTLLLMLCPAVSNAYRAEAAILGSGMSRLRGSSRNPPPLRCRSRVSEWPRVSA